MLHLHIFAEFVDACDGGVDECDVTSSTTWKGQFEALFAGSRGLHRGSNLEAVSEAKRALYRASSSVSHINSNVMKRLRKIIISINK